MSYRSQPHFSVDSSDSSPAGSSTSTGSGAGGRNSGGTAAGGPGDAQLFAKDGSPFKAGPAFARAAEVFDTGLAFAWNHRLRFIQGGFVAGVLEILLAYLPNFFRLSPQEIFLVIMGGVGSTAWLMTYVGVYCLSAFRGEPLAVGPLMVKAIQSMPKIVLSYVVLGAMATALFELRPLLIFAVFVIWAPAFCVAEIYALPLKEPEEGPDDAFDDDSERRLPKFRFFQGRPPWDLGFARSIAFVGQNFGLSMQISLFAWAVVVVPSGVMLLLAGYYPSFSSIMLETLAVNMLEALLLGAGMASFLLRLPQEARAELGLPTAEALLKSIPRSEVPGVLQFRRKRYPLVIVMLLGLISTQLTWQWFNHQHSAPDTVQSTLEGSQLTKDRLIVTVQLSDEQQLFRWLDSGRLRLRITDASGKLVPPAGNDSAVPVANGAEPAGAQKTAVARQADKNGPATALDEVGERDFHDPTLFEPERVMPYSVEGAPLDESNYTPYNRPLRLVLFFEKPAIEKGKFQLFHRSFFGLGKPMVEGEFSSQEGGSADGKRT